MYNAFWNNWASPQRVGEIYAKTVSNFADNVMATSRIANNTLFANIGAYKTIGQRQIDDVKDFREWLLIPQERLKTRQGNLPNNRKNYVR
jgi:hypothetical protein